MLEVEGSGLYGVGHLATVDPRYALKWLEISL